ncbi:hypothetical protein P9112_009959 [Eukaryota sp. TZLM1-RC]
MSPRRHFFTPEEDNLILIYVVQKLHQVDGDLDRLKLGGNVFWQKATEHFFTESQLLCHTYQSIGDIFHKYLKKEFIKTIEDPSSNIPRSHSPHSLKISPEVSLFAEINVDIENLPQFRCERI